MWILVDNNIDLLLTDPPYGINADLEASKNEGKWGWKYYGETPFLLNLAEPESLRMSLSHSPRPNLHSYMRCLESHLKGVSSKILFYGLCAA